MNSSKQLTSCSSNGLHEISRVSFKYVRWCAALLFLFHVCSAMGATTQFAGLWRNGSDGNYVYYGLSAASLLDLANQYHTNGLRLVNIHSYVDSGNRVWSAIWRGGSDS